MFVATPVYSYEADAKNHRTSWDPHVACIAYFCSLHAVIAYGDVCCADALVPPLHCLWESVNGGVLYGASVADTESILKRADLVVTVVNVANCHNY